MKTVPAFLIALSIFLLNQIQLFAGPPGPPDYDIVECTVQLDGTVKLRVQNSSYGVADNIYFVISDADYNAIYERNFTGTAIDSLADFYGYILDSEHFPIVVNSEYLITIEASNTYGYDSDYDEISFEYIIPNPPPVPPIRISISTAVTGIIYTTVAAFTVMDSHYVTHYKFKLDGGGWSAEFPRTQNVSLSGLSEGPHSISFIGRGTGAWNAWMSEDNATTITFTVCLPGRIYPTNGKNAVLTQIINTPITSLTQKDGLTGDSIHHSIVYSSQLGKPVQSVAVQGSNVRKDLVTPIVYDNLGLQTKSYLPYAAAADKGGFQDNALTAQSSFYQNADKVAHTAYPYSETVNQKSPLLLPLEQSAPGESWRIGNGHTVKTVYRTNTTQEVRNWVISSGDLNGAGFYQPGQLKVIETTDENGNTSTVYTDKYDKTILKKSVKGSDNVLTYYVYDKYQNLKYIIPPEACTAAASSNWILNSNMIATWVTVFVYDGYQRLVEKKIPEAYAIYTVYDQLGRVVATQDGLLREQKKWMFTKYDALGRPVMTGIYTDNTNLNRSMMQDYVDAFVNNSTTFYHENRSSASYSTRFGYTNQAFPNLDNCEIWTVTYYDDYDFNYDGTADVAYQADGEFTNTSFNRLKGKVTGSRVRVAGGNVRLENGNLILDREYNSGTEKIFDVNNLPADVVPVEWLSSVSFYDKYGQVIQSRSDNTMKGVDLSYTAYDFSGKVLKTKTVHQTTACTVTVKKRFTYDHKGRPVRTYQVNNSDSEVMTSSLKYNELGQLIEKNLDSCASHTAPLQSVDFRYNIRGWLKSINNRWLSNYPENNDDANDLFGMEFMYDYGSTDLNSVAQYNGNISDIRWQTRSTSVEHGYGYQYDQLNQLKSAKFATWGAGGWSQDNKYSLNSITYDLNGNIQTMSQNWNGALADNLTYTYKGNMLRCVNDAVNNSASTNDFEDNGIKLIHEDGNPATYEYLYDGNGNMIQDKNKNITVTYNFMNLPTVVDFGSGNKIMWIYSVTGAKLRKNVYTNNTLTLTQDYVSGFVYKNSQLDFFGMEEGRVKKLANGSLQYQYTIKDHLGNTRVMFADVDGNGTIDPNTEILQEDHYYAFGLRIEGLSSSNKDNKFTYNGKELEDDHGLNWYHYGARYYDGQLGRWWTIDPKDEFYSPYCYVKNDPISFIDQDGTGIGGNKAGQELMKQMVGTENLKYISFDEKTGLITIMDGFNREATEGSNAIYLAWRLDEKVRLDVTDEKVPLLVWRADKNEAYQQQISATTEKYGILSLVKDGRQNVDNSTNTSMYSREPSIVGYDAHIIIAESGKWTDIITGDLLSKVKLATHEVGEVYAMIKWGVPRYDAAHNWAIKQFPNSAAGQVRYEYKEGLIDASY